MSDTWKFVAKRTYIGVLIKDNDYFNDVEIMWLDSEEIYYIYQRDTLYFSHKLLVFVNVLHIFYRYLTYVYSLFMWPQAHSTPPRLEIQRYCKEGIYTVGFTDIVVSQ